VLVTKYTHACVRLEAHGATLVVDPGAWSEPMELRGADAVLITHEHSDHIDVLRLTGLGAPVYAPAGADISGPNITWVQPGETFTAAGFTIQAVGGKHATIYGDQPACVNLGYIIDDRLYHPGDSLYVPERSVETLLVPLQASWLKTAEAIEFVKAVAPERAFGIHDGQLNERGLASTNAWIGEEGGHGYRWLLPGQQL